MLNKDYHKIIFLMLFINLTTIVNASLFTGFSSTRDHRPPSITRSALPPFQCPEESGWAMQGNYFDYTKYFDGTVITNEETLINLCRDSIIKELCLLGYDHQSTQLVIEFSKKPIIKIKNIYKALNIRSDDHTDILFDSKIMYLTDNFSQLKVLEYFYNQGHIPDFIIDRILALKEFITEDFRVNGSQIIRLFETQFLNNNPKEEIAIDYLSIEDFFNNQLSKIVNTTRKQQVCWDIIQYLQNKINTSHELAISLCEQIVDPSLSFYAQAKLMIAENAFAREKTENETITNHYRQPLIEALKATNNKSSSQFLNTIIQSYLNNDKLDGDLQLAYQNLTVSPERMVDMLEQKRLDNIAFKNLVGQNQQLQDENAHLKIELEKIKTKNL